MLFASPSICELEIQAKVYQLTIWIRIHRLFFDPAKSFCFESIAAESFEVLLFLKPKVYKLSNIGIAVFDFHQFFFVKTNEVSLRVSTCFPLWLVNIRNNITVIVTRV